MGGLIKRGTINTAIVMKISARGGTVTMIILVLEKKTCQDRINRLSIDSQCEYPAEERRRALSPQTGPVCDWLSLR